MPSGPGISNVSETALFVAMYRALESDRPDALFRDPHARALAGERGEEILRTLPKARQMAWPMIVRTAVMDEIILRAVRRDGVDTVVNLAAGLDTRAYRLPLAASLRWIDADLPEMLRYREERLRGERAVCTHEAAPVDLTVAAERRELLGRVGALATNALVVTEGLLVYLQPGQVADLARDLAAQSAFRWWLTDLGSPRLLKMLERTWGKALRAGNAPMVFGPAEGTAFFEPVGWREVEFRSTWEESLRLNRKMRFAGLWSLLGRLYPRRTREEFRRMSGIVLLRRADG